MENITINHALNPYLDSTDYSAKQLILPLDCGVLIEKNDPVRSFCEILEGVNLKEIDPKTLQSKIHPWLSICGESLDVNSLTGGYNMTVAFSTGYTAGINI